jgi:hypothetical protein
MKEGEIMRCSRCGGMMSYEKFYGDCERFFGWRCIVCAEIIDQVILENRLEQKGGNRWDKRYRGNGNRSSVLIGRKKQRSCANGTSFLRRVTVSKEL